MEMGSSFFNNNHHHHYHHQYAVNTLDNNNIIINDEFFDLKPFSTNHHQAASFINPPAFSKSIWSSPTAEEDHYHHHQKAAAASSAFSSASPQLISFGKSSYSAPPPDEESDMLLDDMVCNRTRSITRSPLQAQYHVEAERKRRERLSDLFISLSKIVPGLKKLDKASLLGDAIKYMKELQERVRSLEEEESKRSSSSSNSSSMDHHNINAVEITRSSSSNISTCDNINDDVIREETNNNIPDIRIKISNNNFLIKIHCQKKYILNNNNGGGGGFVSRIPTEMEKLHLTILDIRVIPFGRTALDITLLAQMDREFSTTTVVKDIIKHLQIAIFSPHHHHQTLNNNINNNVLISDIDSCFHHLSPLSGSEEAWQQP